MPKQWIRKKRKEKTTPFGVNLTRSLVIYQAAQKTMDYTLSLNACTGIHLHKCDASPLTARFVAFRAMSKDQHVVVTLDWFMSLSQMSHSVQSATS